ncbi:NAD-dependent epimerase/dehydratase family protein [Candidatus Nitrosopelagicus sp.]|nr:NAD-dependent epimerase/dehydratase family protein [Candidatus Nitrosopelagicus sp.]
MSSIRTVLITGGAGYVGSILTKKLENEGYNVKVVDSLVFGNDGISSLINEKRIEFFNQDIRNTEKIIPILKDVDCVIHLAAIVGEPLCKKIPHAAKQINEFATKNLVSVCKKNHVKRFIFASTCSNYGSNQNIVNELSDVQPLSLYSECKVNSEEFILNMNTNDFETCILRFATAHGLSPRMRFDLLVQEFLRDAIVDKKISIFGADFWRPLIHVEDMANACTLVLKAPSELVSGEIYNVGGDNENYTKRELATIIQEFIDDVDIDIISSKKDPRNYKVSFEKIKNVLGFEVKKTVKDSVNEILKEVKSGSLSPQDSEFSNMSKLTEKIKPLISYNFDENL